MQSSFLQSYWSQIKTTLFQVFILQLLKQFFYSHALEYSVTPAQWQAPSWGHGISCAGGSASLLRDASVIVAGSSLRALSLPTLILREHLIII